MSAEHELPGEDGNDPLRAFLESLLGPGNADEALNALQSSGLSFASLPGMNSPQALSQALGQMRFLMSSSSDPVNWRMVEEISRQTAYQSGDPRLSAAQANRVRQSLAVADLWLDPVTEFSVPGVERDAWTRVEWIDQTLPAWKHICDPIARNASRAMSEAMQDQMDGAGMGVPEEMAGLAKSLSSMMPKMAAMAFAAQIGNALAEMAKEALGTSDSGMPLTDGGVTALVPTNLGSFAEGLDVPYDEVEQFAAVRECAQVRLFGSVPWLRHDLLVAIERYAEEIALDEDAIMDAARSINPADPESLREAMSQGVFAAEPTQSQLRAQQRLETMLALIEGWVEVTTTAASAPYLPHSSQLREMMRRRRVTGSSAEHLLRELVGLELRPRQTRGAAAIFRRLQDEGGAAARDALWAHPDRVPTAEQLEDPDSFFAAAEPDPELTDLDQQLSALLEGTLGFDDSVPPEMRGEDEASSGESSQ